MEHRFLKALKRILDATAFSNVDHMRDFEELLERNDGRERPDGHPDGHPGAPYAAEHATGRREPIVS